MARMHVSDQFFYYKAYLNSFNVCKIVFANVYHVVNMPFFPIFKKQLKLICATRRHYLCLVAFAYGRLNYLFFYYCG